MVKGTCTKPDCTVSQTGICLLSASDPTACPNFQPLPPETGDASVEVPEPVVEAPPTPSNRRFHGGLELGTREAAQIMRNRYCHLVGILGSVAAGKTCLLSSLYLMVAHGDLAPAYLFAGSESLQGFEDRARGARRWSGNVLPDKLADHTSLSDPRSPALLHLALQECQDRFRRLELLFTDLPGEWSDNLINRADAASRFRFLQRADGVVLVVDGQLLSGADRHAECERAKMLVRRLAEAVQLDRSVPMILAVSKCDQIAMKQPDKARELLTFISNLGYSAQIMLTAAFSSDPARIKSGTGVVEIVKAITDHVPTAISDKVNQPLSGDGRMFQKFRQ